MSNNLPTFAQCSQAVLTVFTAPLPHLNCLGYGQQTFFSTSPNAPCHFSLSLWLRLWPRLASFFTLSATSQPSLGAFFICFGMKTWLQLVGKVVWRGRGGRFSQSREQSTSCSLWAAHLPWRWGGFHLWLLWSQGEGGKKVFFYFSGLINTKPGHNLRFALHEF